MQAAAAIALLLMRVKHAAGIGQAAAARVRAADAATQQTSATPPSVVSRSTGSEPGLPPTPAPKLTEPLYLRDTAKDYTQPASDFPESAEARIRRPMCPRRGWRIRRGWIRCCATGRFI